MRVRNDVLPIAALLLLGSFAFVHLMALPVFADEGGQIRWIWRAIEAGEWLHPLSDGKPLEDAGPVSALLYSVVLPYVRARRAHPTPSDLLMQRFGLGGQPTDAEVRALDFYRMPGTATYLATLRE